MKHFFNIIILPILIGIVLYRTQISDIVNNKLHLAQQYFSTTEDLLNNRLDHQNHLFATEMSVSRGIAKVLLAREQSEGAGARVRRSIGTPQLRNFSPFLMLDHFSIKPGAGFPDQ
jgi:quercetin 2,3-dioxygenase